MKDNITTVFGLEIEKIRWIIDWFKERGFDPYQWDEFKEQISMWGGEMKQEVDEFEIEVGKLSTGFYIKAFKRFLESKEIKPSDLPIECDLPVEYRRYIDGVLYVENTFIDRLAEKGGFKSATEMFVCFNKKYDLSSPKIFCVHRWNNKQKINIGRCKTKTKRKR